MELENPYLDRKRELTVLIDSAKKQRKTATEILELQEEYEVILSKERRFWQEQLDELEADIEKVAVKMQEVKEKYPTKKQQYERAITLYREIVGYQVNGEIVREGLVQKARELKKKLR